MKVTKEFRIGVVVLIAIILFVWGFNFIKGTNIFSNDKTYFAVYPNTDGLVESNPVILKGMKVGQVKSREFLLSDSIRILVEFSVNVEGLEIPDDSHARIYGTSLLGDKAIELILGESSKLASPGDTLSSLVSESFEDKIDATIAPIQTEAKKLMEDLGKVLGIIRKIFNEKTSETIQTSFARLEKTIKNFESTSSSLDTLIDSQKGNVKQISTGFVSLANNFKDNKTEIDSTIKNLSRLSKTLSDAELSEAIKNFKESLTKTNKVLTKVNTGDNSVSKLLNSSQLHDDLDKLLVSLDKLVNDIYNNPKNFTKPLGRNKPKR